MPSKRPMELKLKEEDRRVEGEEDGGEVGGRKGTHIDNSVEPRPEEV